MGASVFVPGLGFRSTEGVRLAEPLTVTRENDQGLRVMHLASTERGTELAFEVRDKDREGTCMIGPADNSWMHGLRVELRTERGEPVARSRQAGQSMSMGMHEYGFYRADVVFEPLPRDARRVTLAIRGSLGEWEVPIDVAPIEDTSVPRSVPIDAEAEHRGITVKIVSVVMTEAATVLEVEAWALPPTGAILGIGAEVVRHGDDAFVLVDEHRRRFVEQPSRYPGRADHSDGSHTVAQFPALPSDSRRLTLMVPAVVVEEKDVSLELELPILEPVETQLGSYPVRIGSARVSDEVRAAPGEGGSHGIEVKFAPAGWFDGGRVLRPRRMTVDGVEKHFGWGRRGDPEALTLTAPLAVGADAQTLVLIDGTVKVRGPWEIAFRRP